MKAEDSVVIEVVKATANKHLLPLHQLFNLSTNICAVGVHKTPTHKILNQLTLNGELFILAKDNETGEVEGYVGSIISVFDKEKHAEQYETAAIRFGAKYYDYNQYNCIFVVKNLTKINKLTIEKLLNNREYLKQKDKKFNLTKFFCQRTNQLYLKKK